MKRNCTVGAVSIAIVCLSVAPAVADFGISGGAGGYNLATVTSDVANPGSFAITGTSPSHDTDVEFHLHAHSPKCPTTGPSCGWIGRTTCTSADISTGEIGVAMLSHTNALVRDGLGPFSYIDAWMHDTYRINPGGGFDTGDPVTIIFLASWVGDVLLEGGPDGGSAVYYRARLKLGSSVLAELDSTDNSLYPPEDFAVNRSAFEFVSVNVGDTLTFDYYISLDLNGSGYSGDAGPSGDNNLDFLTTGTGQIGYAPGYEDLNISSDAGATIVPEPATLSLLTLAMVMLVRRRRCRKAW